VGGKKEIKKCLLATLVLNWLFDIIIVLFLFNLYLCYKTENLRRVVWWARRCLQNHTKIIVEDPALIEENYCYSLY